MPEERKKAEQIKRRNIREEYEKAIQEHREWIQQKREWRDIHEMLKKACENEKMREKKE